MNPLRFLLLSCVLTFVIISANSQPLPETMWSDQATISWYDSFENEFTLTTPQELAGLSLLVADGNDFADRTIILGADINLDGHLWTPIGSFEDFPFSGKVEGNHHAISNMWIFMVNRNFVGLFGRCNGASLANIRVDTARVQGFTDVGVLVGRLNNSTVENCHVTKVIIGGGGCNVGGLIGNAQYESSIAWSSAQGHVYGFCQAGGLVGALYEKGSVSTSFAEGLVAGRVWVGGLVGISITGAEPDRINGIVNCYTRSDVSTEFNRGGGLLGGGDQFEIQNSYCTGYVETDTINGSFIGNVVDGTGQNNYFDLETAGDNDPVGLFDGPPLDLGITAKPTAEMKTEDMVDLLNAGDPDGPWVLVPDENDGYPILAGAPLSTSETLKSGQAMRIYPTVFGDSFTVECDVTMERYEIYNVSGALMVSGELNTKGGEVTPRQLTSGMYIVRVYTQKGVLSKKVIKE